jgi:transmembrane sensor
MEYEDRIPELIIKFLKGTLIADEATELDKWVCASEDNKRFFVKATNDELLAEEFKLFNRDDITPRLNKTLEAIDTGSRGGRLVGMKKYLVAASLVVVAGAGLFFWTRNGNKKEVAKTTNRNNSVKHDILPDTKATLTLSDGSTIELDKSKGTIAQESGTTITNQDAQLVYDVTKASSRANHSALSYNTVSTRGGQYQLVLPDGSRVWLNSSTSIRFPTAFTGKQRNIEITGEAFFMVSKDAAKPFVVSIRSAAGMDKGKVEVLGTHFNIMAYDDENSVKATLLEGSVKVSKGNILKMLSPGKQAQIIPDGQIQIAQNVDLDETVAWKNNEFQFHDLDIKSVMRQVQRYYDVQIVYEGNVTTKTYTGVISRNVPASDLLNLLEMSGGVHFAILEKKIIVKP